MRAPEFEAMIAPAKLYREWWRLLLGLVVIVFCVMGVLAMQTVALFAIVGPFEFPRIATSLAEPDQPLPTVLILATFVGMLIAPMMAAAACHYRGPGTLFGPWGETWRGLLVAFLVAVPAYATLTAVGAVITPPADNLDWPTWMGWLPYVVPLLLIQVMAEELLFRGYLQQQLAALTRWRVIWMGLPALIFSVLHWNPAAGALLPLVLLTTFVFGLIAADLTEKTGSLGAAIGLHFVNNFFGLVVIAMSGTITGVARWTTPFSFEDPGPLGWAFGFNILFLLVVWRLLRWALDR